jgi:hypothetical protein
MRLANMRIMTLATLCAVGFFLSSCAGGPVANAPGVGPVVSQKPAENAPVEVKPQESPSPAPVQPFDPSAVTEVVKTATFVDVRALIESLNELIRNQDYEAWLSHLTKGYIASYSDPATLSRYSESPIIKRKGIKLLTLKDYFVNVVYPSHQNDKVDDIEFVDENLIKAITVSPKGDRNILYMLEKHGDAWMIGIGR